MLGVGEAKELLKPLIHGMGVSFLPLRGSAMVPFPEKGRGVAGILQGLGHGHFRGW